MTSFESVSTWRQPAPASASASRRRLVNEIAATVSRVVMASTDAVLIVDSVFAFRPEYNTFWDYRIWLDVDAQLSLTRGISRDTDAEGLEEATRLHIDRYHAAAAIYVAEVDPCTIADVIIDNSNFANPRILHSRHG